MPVSVLTWHSKRRSQRSSSRERHIGDVVESWRVFSNGDSFLIVMRNENGTPIQLVCISGTKISAEQHFQAPRLPNRKLPLQPVFMRRSKPGLQASSQIRQALFVVLHHGRRFPGADGPNKEKGPAPDWPSLLLLGCLTESSYSP